MLFTKQQTKHSFIIPTGKSLWQLLTFFFCKNKKMIHMHTHTLTFWHLGVQTVRTWNRHLHQNEKVGQLNLGRLPGPVGWGTRNTWPVLPVFSYIKNTRFWRWMWSCHHFVPYELLLKEDSSTSLPCVVPCRSDPGMEDLFCTSSA